jgi:hypothetical protein
MKKIFFLILINSVLLSDWILKKATFIIENDADLRTDRDYTHGSSIGMLYERKKNELLSFHYAQQMYTPKSFKEEDLQVNERPYAGYMYIDTSFLKIKNNTLDSYTFSIGLVGPSTCMENIQKLIHETIGANEPLGWQYQIKDELILQFNYEKRWFFDLKDIHFLKNNTVFYSGVNLGNVSTKVNSGVFYKIGEKIDKNFAPRRIDFRGYNNIPLEKYKSLYALSFNFWLEANVVLRDIFLDGNTFKDSHNVDKYPFVLKGGYGISFRYKNFEIDYLRTHSTKEFKTQTYYHHYGSLIFSYNF